MIRRIHIWVNSTVGEAAAAPACSPSSGLVIQLCKQLHDDSIEVLFQFKYWTCLHTSFSCSLDIQFSTLVPLDAMVHVWDLGFLTEHTHTHTYISTHSVPQTRVQPGFVFYHPRWKCCLENPAGIRPSRTGFAWFLDVKHIKERPPGLCTAYNRTDSNYIYLCYQICRTERETSLPMRWHPSASPAPKNLRTRLIGDRTRGRKFTVTACS